MFSVQQCYGTWRVITFRPQTVWKLCACDCHASADGVLRVHEQRGGGAKKQVTDRRQREKRAPCQPVLDHFDQQYSRELGEDVWASARSVLLEPPSWQYGVLLNRFTPVSDLTQTLLSRGFSALQTHPPTLLSDGLATVPNSPQDSSPSCPIDDPHPRPDGSPPPDPFSRPSLRCFVHPCGAARFPSQAHRPGQLKQRYVLNAASLLPVLALGVADGERVLDLCSAPGGKALAVMQCATPALLCCNEPDAHRREWLAKTLESFIPRSVAGRVVVSALDGRSFGQREAGTYDKVLVDAPCSNDRSWLYSCSSQQGEHRLRERARLPALQAQLLRSALSAVRPGGAVVYSTCTLSSSENRSVVEAVLRDCPEAQPEDLWDELAAPLSRHFAFAPDPPACTQTAQTQDNGAVSSSNRRHRLGILVVPQPGKTWGPMFVARLRRKE